jgi:peptidoglycan/xylan/chitin deacetylase (PgdA/CDA1 family)
MPTNAQVIALTFDDGPAGNWRQLLDILDSRNVKATFFLLGNLSLNNPEAVRETAARGHELANHTWSHPKLPDLSIERIRWQISSGAAAIEAAGVKIAPFFRPPYGARDDRVDQAARELGFHTILWDVDTRDWELKDPSAVLQRALAGLKPGAIILFHDGPATTPQMLGAFIDQAHAQGYEFVLLSRHIR